MTGNLNSVHLSVCSFKKRLTNSSCFHTIQIPQLEITIISVQVISGCSRCQLWQAREENGVQQCSTLLSRFHGCDSRIVLKNDLEKKSLSILLVEEEQKAKPMKREDFCQEQQNHPFKGYGLPVMKSELQLAFLNI